MCVQLWVKKRAQRGCARCVYIHRCARGEVAPWRGCAWAASTRSLWTSMANFLALIRSIAVIFLPSFSFLSTLPPLPLPLPLPTSSSRCRPVAFPSSSLPPRWAPSPPPPCTSFPPAESFASPDSPLSSCPSTPPPRAPPSVLSSPRFALLLSVSSIFSPLSPPLPPPRLRLSASLAASCAALSNALLAFSLALSFSRIISAQSIRVQISQLMRWMFRDSLPMPWSPWSFDLSSRW